MKVNECKISNPQIEKGYLKLSREWQTGDTIVLELSMPVEIICPDTRVQANKGKLAVKRGPLVYCIEEADQKMDAEKIFITRNDNFSVEYKKDFLDGVAVIHAQSSCMKEKYLMVPYYDWDNRTPGYMRVWLPAKALSNWEHDTNFQQGEAVEFMR